LPQGGEAVSAGIGLSNTEARLRTIYGDRHRFELVNGRGLSVHLHLPLSKLTSREQKSS
jgi:sensor histidine kinase YesM